MLVKIKNNNDRLGVKAEEIYEAERYWLDPDKITLLRRVPDGWEPECNQYRDDVEILRRLSARVATNSMIALLTAVEYLGENATTANIGWELWAKEESLSNRSLYCRPAGSLLRFAQKKGLVRQEARVGESALWDLER